MKTTVKIEFETKNMNEVREETESLQFDGQVITEEVEKELHKAFKSWLKRPGFIRENFADALGNCDCGDADETIYSVEGFDDGLESYGEVHIRLDGEEL